MAAKSKKKIEKPLSKFEQKLIHKDLEALLIPLSFLAKVLFGTKFRNKLKNQFQIFAMLWLNNSCT